MPTLRIPQRLATALGPIKRYLDDQLSAGGLPNAHYSVEIIDDASDHQSELKFVGDDIPPHQRAVYEEAIAIWTLNRVIDQSDPWQTCHNLVDE